jgi:SOS-response transcriptional repressor LexA
MTLRCPNCAHTWEPPAPRPLTKRQADVVHVIADHVREHGYAPTLTEIAATMGFKSVASVHEHLVNLENKRVIRRRFDERRSIELLVRIDELGMPDATAPAMEVLP